MLSVILSILLVYFIFELSPSANGYNVFSTNFESFSSTVLQPLVITGSGLSSLCVFTIPYILPALQLSGVINSFYLFVIVSDHFSNQLFTFSLNLEFGSASSLSKELVFI